MTPRQATQAEAIAAAVDLAAARYEAGLPWHLSLSVDTPRELRLRRALRRDGARMLATWLTAWMPSEEACITAQRPRQRVDLVVSGIEER